MSSDNLFNEYTQSIDIFPETTCPEERLWRFVIIQALLDASLDQTTAKNKQWLSKAHQLSKDAKNWILHGKDFNKVCELANLPADLTRNVLLEYLTNPQNKTLSQIRSEVDKYETQKIKILRIDSYSDLSTKAQKRKTRQCLNNRTNTEYKKRSVEHIR